MKLWLKERKSLLTFSCSYSGKCSALASDVLMISNSIFIRSPSSIQKTAEHFLHNPLHRNKFSPFVFSGTFHWGCSLVSLHLHRAQWPLIGLTLVDEGPNTTHGITTGRRNFRPSGKDRRKFSPHTLFKFPSLADRICTIFFHNLVANIQEDICIINSQ